MSIITPIVRTGKSNYAQKTHNNMTNVSENSVTKPVYTIPYINYEIDKDTFHYYMILIIVICLTWYSVGIFKYVQKQPRLLFILLGIVIFCLMQMTTQSGIVESSSVELSYLLTVEQMSGLMIGTIVLFLVFNKFNMDKTVQYILLLSILSLCIPNFFWGIKRDNFGLSSLRVKKQVFLLYGIVMFMTSIVIIMIDITN